MQSVCFSQCGSCFICATRLFLTIWELFYQCNPFVSHNGEVVLSVQSLCSMFYQCYLFISHNVGVVLSNHCQVNCSCDPINRVLLVQSVGSDFYNENDQSRQNISYFVWHRHFSFPRSRGIHVISARHSPCTVVLSWPPFTCGPTSITLTQSNSACTLSKMHLPILRLSSPLAHDEWTDHFDNALSAYIRCPYHCSHPHFKANASGLRISNVLDSSRAWTRIYRQYIAHITTETR